MTNEINEYINSKGESPYADWLDRLLDVGAKAKVMIRVDRMELGLFGDVKPIGDGLSGLRIHYGRVRDKVYLLLCGGEKSSQKKDIKLAKSYWQDHKRRN